MNNTEVYQAVTDKVLKSLEEGKIPWQRPWNEMEVAKNLVSKKPYRGINTFLLSLNDFSSPYWVTFKQAQALGGKIKKGEKATLVVFWKVLKYEDHEAPTGQKTIPLLKYYNVFNVDQTEGIDESKIPEVAKHHDPIEVAEQIIQNMPTVPTITHGGDRAYYMPSADTVNLPRMEQFNTAEGYYATAFHELVHSTGHADRLKREGVMKMERFGDERYSKEELVAEMGSAMLAAVAQIDKPVFDNTKAYIQNWIEKLNSDPRLLVSAAGQAQKAADYVLNVSFEKEKVA